MEPNLEEVDEIEGTYGGPYMVEKILGIYVGKNRKKYYRVKWVDSWEPEDNLSEACQALIDEFWSSPIQDTSGGEVNRTDLKSGQKIIKKEFQQPSDESNPDSPEEEPQRFLNPGSTRSVIPTLKADLGASNQPADMPLLVPVLTAAVLKTELMSPTAVIKDSSSLTSTSTSANTTTAIEKSKDSGRGNTKKTCSSNVQTDPVVSTTTTTKSVSTDTSKLPVNNNKRQTDTSKVPVNNNKRQTDTSKVLVNNNKRQSMDSQTQTSDTEDDELCYPSLQHASIGTLANNTVSVSTDPLEVDIRAPPLVAPQPQNLADEDDGIMVQDIDPQSEELSFSESDVVDLASDGEGEDDVEITCSFSTPSSKRVRLEKPQHAASASRVERRVREKTTQRRRRNSEGEQSVPARPLLHPRSLLPSLPGAYSDTAVIATATNIPRGRPPLQLNQQTNNSSRSTTSGRKRPINFQTQQRTEANASSNRLSSPSNNLTDRTCNICKHTFPNLTLARQHFKRVHVPLSPQTSSSRKSNTTTGPSQRQQQQQQSLSRQQPSSQRPSQSQAPTDFTCHVCFGFFRNSRDLKSHMLLHTEKNLPKCEVCLRTFKNKSTLNQHMLLHSGELPYECETCGERFRQQGHLINHMGKHAQNNEGTLTCLHCEQQFTDNNEFRNHVRSHESELPFKCSQCLERFENKGDLMRHLNGHNEGRPFTCPTCKKSFKTKTYLFGHMQMHKVPSKVNNNSTASSSSAGEQRQARTVSPAHDNTQIPTYSSATQPPSSVAPSTTIVKMQHDN